MNVCCSNGLYITGNDLELCFLARTLEAARLDPCWDSEGNTLILDDDEHPQDKVISFLKAYFELRNLDYEINGDSL
ncbi:hypothetical protein [Nostoc sp. NMS8]|uniref:hypothetical protein n=1 Tax=Nostoc sp. NMS8 TaxID=2815392 RepID=UPI0025E0F3F6|nr:hypothetical protein [Nostoc sp. NMS8]MBN3957515.1 hypothetical protein [Nostoc sp. NMS8]